MDLLVVLSGPSVYACADGVIRTGTVSSGHLLLTVTDYCVITILVLVHQCMKRSKLTVVLWPETMQ